jgi:hypothetical protein
MKTEFEKFKEAVKVVIKAPKEKKRKKPKPRKPKDKEAQK